MHPPLPIRFTSSPVPPEFNWAPGGQESNSCTGEGGKEVTPTGASFSFVAEAGDGGGVR